MARNKFEFPLVHVTEIAWRYYEAYGIVLPVRTAAFADKVVGKL
jgi:hypothetical protein